MAAGLVLIGMGLGGINGMTLDAIKEATEADHRFYESYTALWSDEDIIEFEKEVGEVKTVMRPEVENPTEILELAKNSRVALLVVGDPLQATTHVDLQLRALEIGVECKVVHGISITGLVTGAVGLSNYKFGRQTTLTYPYNGWVATSPLEVIALNRYQNLHTLVLLDLDPTGEGVGNQIPMKPKDAADSLFLMAEKLASNQESFNTDSAFENMKAKACIDICENIRSLDIVLCSDMGTASQNIVHTTIDGLKSLTKGRLHCLVIPAGLSEIEQNAIKRWSKN